MKTLKTMLVAVVAMAMTAGVAQAGIGSVLKKAKGGLSKAVGAVKQAPGQAVDGLKTAWNKTNDAIGGNIVRGAKKVPAVLKTGWNKTNDAIGGNIVRGAKKVPAVLKTGWNKTNDAIGGNIVRGGKKAVSAVKKLFKR